MESPSTCTDVIAEGDPAGVSLAYTGYIWGLGTEDRWPMRVQDVVKELQPFWSSNDPVPDVAAFQPIERAIGRALPASGVLGDDQPIDVFLRATPALPVLRYDGIPTLDA